MKKIIDWILTSNHYLHIIGCVGVTVFAYAIMLLFGVGVATMSAFVAVLSAALSIEVYQVCAAGWKWSAFSFQDLLADGIGFVVGICLCHFFSFFPQRFGVCACIAALLLLLAFIVFWFENNKKLSYITAACAILSGVVGFIAFIMV